jgi:hypothetical protein
LRFIVFSAAVTCFACTARDSARLEVKPDTLSLYGSDYSWVTVNIINSGSISEAHGASLSARDTSMVRTSGTSLACLREGTTIIDIAVDELTTTFVATCRFAARLHVEPHLILESGGAPHDLAATAIFSTGEARVLQPLSARVNDTTVVVVRNGAAVPLAVGQAGLRIDYGGLWSRMGIDVRHTISNDTVTLGTGERRDWRLEAGRYDITVRMKSSRDLSILTMETEGLRCARDSGDEDTIHCVSDVPAEVTFRNTSGGGTARTAGAFVRIVQVR